MMGSQLVTSMPDDSETVQPDHQSAVVSKAESFSAALDHEDAFVSGALRVSEDSISFHAASQGPGNSISQTSAFGRTSLEALELAPSFVHVALSENEEALSTALPVSDDEELLGISEDVGSDIARRRQSQGASSQGPATLAVKPYASAIETLGLHLPHLTNVRSSSRQKNVSVTCYDYSDNLMASAETFSAMQSSGELQTAEGISLQRYLGEIPPNNVQLRLVVTNDLSTDLIECLGSSLSMSPEVYEEHLVNSGWQNGTDNDQEPDTWITRDMKKTHMSIKWYRPVKRVLQRPHSASDRLKFLDSRAHRFSWSELVPGRLGKFHGVQHVSTPATNIFRRGWDMKTDAEVTVSTGGFAAWEERATLWNKQCEGYRIGDDIAVLLLDPLPIVQDEMKGAAEALRKLGVDDTEPTVKRGAISKGLNEKEPSATDQPSRGLVKSSTFVRYRPKADQNFSLRSLASLMFGKSPRPQHPSATVGLPTEEPEATQHAEDPESGEHGRDHQQRVTGISRPKARGRVPILLGRLFGRSRRKPGKSDGADEVEVPEEEVGTEMKTLRPMNRCMFEGLYPRGPAVDYEFLMDPKNVDLLAEHLDRTKPTAANLAEWLTHNDRQQPHIIEPTTHLEYLFAIIQNDTVNTLRHMELALQEIGQHILDDTLIQQRLVHWRLLLERFGTELQQLEDSLRRLAGFIEGSGSSHQNHEEDQDRRTSPVGKLLGDCVSQINSLRQHTKQSHKSLMANMSIVESKRGIAEAESVTKLTELAFFFIPITFSASIFSMQVKELDASRISIAAFFVLAIIVTTGSYALRLLIRSENFIELRRETLKNIRQDAGLASSSSIPTKTFIAWLWRRVGLLTIMVTVLMAFLIIPIAVFWTRDINHGFKILLTILLLVFILAAAYVTGNAMLYIDSRGLHLRRDIFKPGVKVKERPHLPRLTFSESLANLFNWLLSRWVLIGLGVTGVFAGPVAALWTSQLTMGIKVGVTILMTILYVLAIVFVLLYVIQGL